MSEDHLLPPPGIRQMGPPVSGTRLLLVRHGESYANANGVAGGPLGDGGLTPLGRRQAEALAERVAKSEELHGAAAVYASTLPRARETAEILLTALPEHFTLELREELCELSVGEADGMTWREIAERFPLVDWDVNPELPNLPGGESLEAFYSRSVNALTEIVATHPGELVVVVCHGGVIEQALKYAYDEPPTRRLGPRTLNCSMTELEFRHDGVRLLRYNDLAPLPKH